MKSSAFSFPFVVSIHVLGSALLLTVHILQYIQFTKVMRLPLQNWNCTTLHFWAHSSLFEHLNFSHFFSFTCALYRKHQVQIKVNYFICKIGRCLLTRHLNSLNTIDLVQSIRTTNRFGALFSQNNNQIVHIFFFFSILFSDRIQTWWRIQRWSGHEENV